MKQIRLEVMLPFSWWRTKESGSGRELIKPTKQKVPAYLQALIREMASLGQDLTGYEICAVDFKGGYLGLMMPDDFALVNAALHRYFTLSKDVQISGVLFPGSLDMALLSAYQSAGVGPLLFEVPSLMMRECEKYRLPNVRQLLDHTRYLLDSYRERNWGLKLAKNVPGRDADLWEHVVMEILHYQPNHIAFFPLTEEEEGEGFDRALEILSRAGYHKVSKDFLTRAQEDPRCVQQMETAAVGLNGVSILDGFKTVNTGEWETYLKKSSDYRDLLIEVTEL